MRSVASASRTSARIRSLSDSARHLASKSSTVANGIISSGITWQSFWGGLVPDEGQMTAGQCERRKRRRWARLPRRRHHSQGQFRRIRLRAPHYGRLRDESQYRGLGACRIAFRNRPWERFCFGWVVLSFSLRRFYQAPALALIVANLSGKTYQAYRISRRKAIWFRRFRSP